MTNNSSNNEPTVQEQIVGACLLLASVGAGFWARQNWMSVVGLMAVFSMLMGAAAALLTIIAYNKSNGMAETMKYFAIAAAVGGAALSCFLFADWCHDHMADKSVPDVIGISVGIMVLLCSGPVYSAIQKYLR